MSVKKMILSGKEKKRTVFSMFKILYICCSAGNTVKRPLEP
jgi:hypothetical protein